MYKVFNTDKEITDYSNKSGLVKELEETLKKTIKNQTDFEKEELSEEDKMVREELKKLGYLQEN